MCCNLKEPALPKSPAFQAIAPYATAVPTHVVKLCRSLDKPGSSRRYKQFCPVLLLRHVMGLIKSHTETDFSLPCHAQIFLALTQVICVKRGVVDFCCYLSVTPGASLKIVIIIVCWVQKRFSVQHSNKWLYSLCKSHTIRSLPICNRQDWQVPPKHSKPKPRTCWFHRRAAVICYIRQLRQCSDEVDKAFVNHKIAAQHFYDVA